MKTDESVVDFLRALPGKTVPTTLYNITETFDSSSSSSFFNLHPSGGNESCSCFSIQGTPDDPLRHRVFCNWGIENPLRFVSIALSTFSVAIAIVGFGVKEIIEEGEKKRVEEEEEEEVEGEEQGEEQVEEEGKDMMQIVEEEEGRSISEKENISALEGDDYVDNSNDRNDGAATTSVSISSSSSSFVSQPPPPSSPSFFRQCAKSAFLLLGLVNVIVGISIPLYFILVFTLKSSPVFLFFLPFILLRIATPEIIGVMWKNARPAGLDRIYEWVRIRCSGGGKRKKRRRIGRREGEGKESRSDDSVKKVKYFKESEKEREEQNQHEQKQRQHQQQQRYEFGPLWRTLWLSFSPCFLGFILATDSIFDNIVEINSKTFYFPESFVKPLGSQVSPRILVRGNWEANANGVPNNGKGHGQKQKPVAKDEFCVEMLGWGDNQKWNQIAMNFFSTQSNQVVGVSGMHCSRKCFLNASCMHGFGQSLKHFTSENG